MPQPTLEQLVDRLVNPVFDACLADPTAASTPEVNLVFFRLYAELGALSQAYLTAIGPNPSAAKFDDLDAKQLRVFVKYVELLLATTKLATNPENLLPYRDVLNRQVLKCAGAPCALTLGGLLPLVLENIARLQSQYLTRHHGSKTGIQARALYLELTQHGELVFHLLLAEGRPALPAKRLDRAYRVSPLVDLVERATWTYQSTPAELVDA